MLYFTQYFRTVFCDTLSESNLRAIEREYDETKFQIVFNVYTGIQFNA